MKMQLITDSLSQQSVDRIQTFFFDESTGVPELGNLIQPVADFPSHFWKESVTDFKLITF